MNTATEPATDAAGFTEAERDIFGPYFDGQRMRLGDPSKIRRYMVRACGGQPGALLKSIQNPDTPEALKFEQTKQILDAAHFAFELHAFDEASGAGVLEKDVWATIKAFVAFCKKKSPILKSSATCSQPMEASQAAARTTASGSDCC